MTTNNQYTNHEKDDIEKAIMKARERANDDGESVGLEGDNLDGKVIYMNSNTTTY